MVIFQEAIVLQLIGKLNFIIWNLMTLQFQ